MPSWKKVIVSGSDAALNSLNVTNGVTGSLFGTASYATSASQAITASYANFALTTSNSQNAQDILIYVKNVTGAQINKGKVVRISGATGDNALISTASYESDGVSANTLGITNQDIPHDSFGYVITEGTLIGINTNAFSAGQLLYLGAAGSIIGTAPVAPLHAVRLGQVLRVQTNNGSMYVRIDNGYELGELHDVVDTTTTSSYGDLLVKSGSVWINSRQLTGSYGLTGSLNATSFTGSLLGTASIAANSALLGGLGATSFVLNSQTSSMTVLSASFAANASSSLRAVSASNALTASNITPAITNAANNRVLTANGGGTINGESDLTFNGTLLTLNGPFKHGSTNTAPNGDGSHAEGEFTFAGGDGSHAEGAFTSASGQNSHAEGYNTKALDFYSHAEGAYTIATGYASHTEGASTITSGSYSHAEGSGSIARGDYSHAEGEGTQANGNSSHAEGTLTIAFGNSSHAEGLRTLSSGSYSHAEGRFTFAGGDYSHAAGLYTSASGNYQSVIGMYNQPNTNQGAFIIGNGTSDGSRSNLVYASGSQVQITGSLVVTNGITGSLLGTASYATSASQAISSSFAINASSSLRAVSSSNALTASFVTTLNQIVLITGSATIGAASAGPFENTLTLGARDTVAEGGQIGFNAPGGTYTSASFIDNWQDRHRILRGNNTTSQATVASWNLHTSQMGLTAYTGSGAFPGSVTGILGINSSGDVITTTAGGSGTVTSVGGTGTVSGLTLSGNVSGSGNLTLGGTLSVTPSNFSSQTANTFLAAPNGSSGTPTFRTIAAADVPTLNQNTTGTASYATSASQAINATTATQVIGTATGTNTAEIVRGNMADNDQFRILIGGTAGNAGYVELATADDGTEPIYVRQYTGVFSSLTRTATLLDGSGNTQFPGSVSASSFLGPLTGTASYATSASQAISSSFAINASSSLRAVSSSFATLAATATSATTATTANSTVAAATFNNGGTGDASGTTFNGGTARTISYNTVGAPSTGGTGATGTWGISITGNAATATTASYATTAQSVLGTITNASTASNITPAITNTANNRVLTDNGGGTINGESALTFDGTTLILVGKLENGNASCVATGLDSHAEGSDTIASGNHSHAEGISTKAIGGASHAEGYFTSASGLYSHAEGNLTISVGDWSHAEGNVTISVGDWSHAEGLQTSASGDCSHAEGASTNAIGDYSHAEGDTTFAIGSVSHAEGLATNAVGDGAHAEGESTYAGGYASHAAGFYTSASGDYQSVIGIANQPSTNRGAFIIGNGPDDVSSRSNLLYASGSNVQITGSLYVSRSDNQTLSSVFTSPGSKTNPAYTFIGDEDTGMFRQSANTVALSGGGNIRAWVSDTELRLAPGTTTAQSNILMASDDTIPLISYTPRGNVSVGLSTSSSYIEVTDTTSGTGPYYLMFADGTTGYRTTRVDSSTLTFNATTNTLTVANLTGTASYATSASQAISSSRTISSSFALNAGAATNASNIGVTDTTTTNATHYVTFTTGTSGNQILRTDSTTLTFNPSTNIFTVPTVNSTTAVQGGNGSVTTPAFSFSGDTNTGMYNVGADTLGFATNGTARMIISSSGNVGIGTTSPSFPLSFGTGLGNKIALYDAGSGAGYGFGIQSSLLQIFSNASGDDITFGYGNSTALTRNVTFKGSGFVGIGETNPTYRLQVNDAIASVTAFGNFTALQSIGGAGYRWILNNDSTFRLQSTTNGFSTATTPILITSNGALGLNVTPTNTAGRFEASNDIVAYSTSDKRWKNNIVKIDSPLEKISQISGVEFDWIEDEPLHGNKGHDVGVIAQEIELVIPEAVQTRESGMKAVQYDKIIPLLIESIKEQQKQIDELKELVNKLTK